MKPNISLWQFAGFSLSSLLGTILHFLYDWTNQSLIIAPFSGVNESTWEHMKLLYFPIFIFALVQSRFFKYYKNFWNIKLLGISTGLLLIPLLFYTYNGVIGKSPDFINITIFFVSAAASYFLEWRLFKTNKVTNKHSALALCGICFIGILFILFTFITPKIAIFKDPLTGGYGI